MSAIIHLASEAIYTSAGGFQTRTWCGLLHVDQNVHTPFDYRTMQEPFNPDADLREVTCHKCRAAYRAFTKRGNRSSEAHFRGSGL